MRPCLTMWLFLAACKGGKTPVDTGPTCTVGFADRDGDGFGSPRLRTSDCQEPVVQNSDDCDDLFNTAYPGAPEICDGVDNDCDGAIDADDTELDLPLQYVDDDGDGYGGGAGVAACDPLPGHATLGGDCDEQDPLTSPGELESCDGVDNNCDGEVDDDDLDDIDFATAPTWYFDSDGDGFAGPVATSACTQPAGTGTANVDCNDTDLRSYPGADERCNGMDDDCDGFGDLGGPCEAFEGAWVGTFTLVLTGPSTHTCTGTSELTLALVGTPPVQGTYTCTFDSEAGWDLAQHGSIQGVHLEDGTIDGTLVTLGTQTYTWDGAVGGTVTGTASGLFIGTAGTFSVEATLDLGPAPVP